MGNPTVRLSDLAKLALANSESSKETPLVIASDDKQTKIANLVKEVIERQMREEGKLPRMGLTD